MTTTNSITVYEFDALFAYGENIPSDKTILHLIPKPDFDWLKAQCVDEDIDFNDKALSWLRVVQRDKCLAIQVRNYVGVIRTPSGFQIEILPKIGKNFNDNKKIRKLLIDMLRCLDDFRHLKISSAQLAKTQMPLLEVFIYEFLQAVDSIVKRGLRSDYTLEQDNIFVLRGKLLISKHLQQNSHHPDRFFTEHDQFTPNRVENRLLHAALRQVLNITNQQINQKLARELCFVFSEIPASTNVLQDFQRIRLDRGMGYYTDALDWAKLILNEQSPLTGLGKNKAPSLLFQMEVVFEAFIGKNLELQIKKEFALKTQIQSKHLVKHKVNEKMEEWFKLKPDFLIKSKSHHLLVLDAKWKLLDEDKNNSTDKYNLSQSDFYQLYTYGKIYLDGSGDVILIYPKTEKFKKPLPVFYFPKSNEKDDLRLWVLPFCLETKRLIIDDTNTYIKGVFN